MGGIVNLVGIKKRFDYPYERCINTVLKIKIFFKLIKVKALLITISAFCGVIVLFLFNSITLAVLCTAAIFLYRYFSFYGVMHYKSKKAIKMLVNESVIIDTLVSPFSSKINFFKLDCNAWEQGVGSVVDYFVDNYFFQHHESGLYFYNASMPYLTLFFLPWENITSATKDNSCIENYDLFPFDNKSYEINLIKNCKIILPLNKFCLKKIKLTD